MEIGDRENKGRGSRGTVGNKGRERGMRLGLGSEGGRKMRVENCGAMGGSRRKKGRKEEVRVNNGVVSKVNEGIGSKCSECK